MEDHEISGPATAASAEPPTASTSNSTGLKAPRPPAARFTIRHTWAPPVLTATGILFLLALSFWRHHRRVARKRAMSADYNDMRLTGPHGRIAAPLCHTYSLTVTELAASIRTRDAMPMEETPEAEGGELSWRGLDQMRGRDRKRSSVVPAGCFVPPSRKFRAVRRRSQEETVLDMVSSVHENFDPDSIVKLGPRVFHLLSWLATQSHENSAAAAAAGVNGVSRNASTEACQSGGICDEDLNEFDDVCEVSCKNEDREVPDQGSSWWKSGDAVPRMDGNFKRNVDAGYLLDENEPNDKSSGREENQEMNAMYEKLKQSAAEDLETLDSKCQNGKDSHSLETLMKTFSIILALQKAARNTRTRRSCSVGNVSGGLPQVSSTDRLESSHKSSSDNLDLGLLPRSDSPSFSSISYHRRLSHDWYNDEVDFVLPSTNANKPGGSFHSFTAQIHRRRLSMDCYNDEVDFSMDNLAVRPSARKRCTDIEEALSEDTDNDDSDSDDVDDNIRELLRSTMLRLRGQCKGNGLEDINPRLLGVVKATCTQNREESSSASSSGSDDNNHRREHSRSPEETNALLVRADEHSRTCFEGTGESKEQSNRMSTQDSLHHVSGVLCGSNDCSSCVLEVIDEVDPCELSRDLLPANPICTDCRPEVFTIDSLLRGEHQVYGPSPQQSITENERESNPDPQCNLLLQTQRKQMSPNTMGLHPLKGIPDGTTDSRGLRDFIKPREAELLKTKREESEENRVQRANQSSMDFEVETAHHTQKISMDFRKPEPGKGTTRFRNHSVTYGDPYEKASLNIEKKDTSEPLPMDKVSITDSNSHQAISSSQSELPRLYSVDGVRMADRCGVETNFLPHRRHVERVKVSSLQRSLGSKDEDIHSTGSWSVSDGRRSWKEINSGHGPGDFESDAAFPNRHGCFGYEPSRFSESASEHSGYPPHFDHHHQVQIHDANKSHYGQRTDKGDPFQYQHGGVPHHTTSHHHVEHYRNNERPLSIEHAVSSSDTSEFAFSAGQHNTNQWEAGTDKDNLVSYNTAKTPADGLGPLTKRFASHEDQRKRECYSPRNPYVWSLDEVTPPWSIKPSVEKLHQVCKAYSSLDGTMSLRSLGETGSGRERPEGESPEGKSPDTSSNAIFWVDRHSFQQTLV